MDQAITLYDAILMAKVPTAVRVGATRGAILARNSDRVQFLLEQLRSQNLTIRNAALLSIREVPDEKLAAALNAELARAEPELQAQLLLALVDCHNAESIAAIEQLGKGENPEIRRTALTVLGRFGSPAAQVLLTALQSDPTAEERAIVLDGLRSMQGSGVDDLLLQTLRSATSTRTRAELIGLLKSRGVNQASGDILEHARGPNREVSLAALDALQSLAGGKELAALIGLIRSADDEAVRDAAENAVIGACSRVPEENAGAELVFNQLNKATKTAERNSWIRVLTTLGYAKALPVIEAATSDPDEAVAINALEQLGRWPDPSPIETVLKAMDAGASPALKNRAVTSVIDLATTATDEAQSPQAEIVQWLRRADSAATSIAQKRRILGLLGRLKTVESLHLLVRIWIALSFESKPPRGGANRS
jgi:hypothetical protein